jgi:hypothetical protein
MLKSQEEDMQRLALDITECLAEVGLVSEYMLAITFMWYLQCVIIVSELKVNTNTFLLFTSRTFVKHFIVGKGHMRK